MPYRYTLTNLNGLDSIVLTNDPIGWEDGALTIKRSDEYQGAFHQFTTPLKFHCQGGGKQFIDAAYESDDIDGRVDILIEFDCDGSGTYETLYNGILNLASYKTDGDYTTVAVESTDLLTKLYARDEINVDVETTTSIGGKELLPVPTIQLPLQPVIVEFVSEWVIEDGYQHLADGTYEGADIFDAYFTHNSALLRSDWSESVSGVDFNTLGNDNDPINFQRSEVPYMMKMNTPAITYPQRVYWSIDYSGHFNDRETVSGDDNRVAREFKLFLMWGVKKPFTPINERILFNGPDGVGGGYTANDFYYDFNITDSGYMDLNPADEVYLVWYINYETNHQDATLLLNWTYNRSTFKIWGNTIYHPTHTKAVMVHEAFNQVVDAIADSDNNFRSDFYGRTDSSKLAYTSNGCGSMLALTNGLNIRQMAAKPIYHSFKSLFSAMDCLHNLGMGYFEGKIRVEPLSFFFDNTTRVISLPFVNKFETRNDNSRYINKVTIGYNKWQSEFNGGLDDPNANHEYATKVSSAKKVFAKLCDYITSSYTIEFTRRKNIEIAPTEDWRFDNDNFILAVTNKIRVQVKFIADTYELQIPLLINSINPADRIAVTGGANSGTYTVIYAVAIPEINTTSIIVVEPVYNSNGMVTLQNLSGGFYGPEQYPDAFANANGMLAIDTAYNLRLTVKRMLLAHLNVITAGIQKIKGFVSFVKGAGNTALQLTKLDVGCPEDFDGQPISESQSLEWSDDRARNIRPLWFPEIYSFEYPLTYAQFKTIRANPYGYIEFYRFEDDKKAGYILSLDYKLKTGMAKFELLRIYAPEGVGDENGNYVGETINDELIMIRG